ncbi:tRNA-dihydrouridine(47) synthase [NAD(P)(+)]-like isoform X1 [Cryptomeria japonica]|uniref:tRNA-dihydrouridine(47) synthase [NAD(P)(+)]-like isoform X1 n=1 Tax=Cryptomeria japonica TaxID=3369 RepID=UPI0027DA4015|nr:tRNA-dihydrouridine(47) synthase [NAD(P)(+)]-like isoform X1 [Cryptomeria japonica]
MEAQVTEVLPSEDMSDHMGVDIDKANANEVGSACLAKSGEGGEILDYPSAEELVSKARAPVKKEYVRAAPAVRPINECKKVSTEKKSKRQLKRERQQERKSAQNICVAVAKAGDIKACNYGDNCRLSHDLEGFLAQKPPDLPGKCPFIYKTEPCQYGVACRYAGTHKERDSLQVENALSDASFEMNSLVKDLQKLIWKNAVTFPKAEEQLKNLGILEKGKPKSGKTVEKHVAPDHVTEDESVDSPRVEKIDSESSVLSNKSSCPCLSGTENNEGGNNQNGDLPPSKKAKIEDDIVLRDIGAGQITDGDDCQQKTDGVEDGSKSQSEHVKTKIDFDTFETDNDAKLNLREKKLIDFRGKLYLAPLTTVGNLPFRRLCKLLGADITCGEMAMCSNLLQGQASEWALLRRHSSEDLFGVQVCGAYPDIVARAVELIERECVVDFIDINMGCPIDIVVNKGAGSSLLTKPVKMQNVIKAAAATIEKPLTVKVRTGYFEGRNLVHSRILDISKSGAAAITIHGRTRQQRYSKLANWDYINECAQQAPDDLQVVGNGDISAYTDWNEHLNNGANLSTCMVARGALVKPWIFTEIKEQRHWDISSGERFDILKDYVRFALQHWGSDTKGVETTRHFLLEWLSYSCRYIPVGLLDIVPQRINWRPPSYFGRNDLETLMASESAADWIRISEMLLGPAPAGFTFTPKHKSNAYDSTDNG